jgi:hypothetical protein
VGYSVHVTYDHGAFQRAADTPLYHAWMRGKCRRLIQLARTSFNAQETEPGNRPSVNTPPVYNDSYDFHADGMVYVIENNDPTTNWMAPSVGTHPGGGHTRTLMYAPFRHALDALEAEGRL